MLQMSIAINPSIHVASPVVKNSHADINALKSVTLLDNVTKMRQSLLRMVVERDAISLD